MPSDPDSSQPRVSGSPPLACAGVSFRYGKADPVLCGVSISIAAGRVTALVGPNGSGKSTLLGLLAGLRRPAAGSVGLAGRAVGAWTPPERARRLALLPQRPEVAFGYTVREVVGFGCHAAAGTAGGTAAGTAGETDGRTAGQVVADVLERVGLASRADDRFEHLSVGQQQRAALARVLAQVQVGDAGMAVLADEPVSAMDPRHAVECLSLLRSCAASGHAVLVVLHDLNHALRYADDTVLMDDRGSVVAHGPTASVLRPEPLERVFGIGFAFASAGTVLVPRADLSVHAAAGDAGAGEMR